MTDCESLSTVGKRTMFPAPTPFTMLRRLLNVFAASLKSNTDRPCLQVAPAEVSPSTKTSFVPSGENVGTIMAVGPKPQEFADWAVTSTTGELTAVGSWKME